MPKAKSSKGFSPKARKYVTALLLGLSVVIIGIFFAGLAKVSDGLLNRLERRYLPVELQKVGEQQVSELGSHLSPHSGTYHLLFNSFMIIVYL